MSEQHLLWDRKSVNRSYPLTATWSPRIMGWNKLLVTEFISPKRVCFQLFAGSYSPEKYVLSVF